VSYVVQQENGGDFRRRKRDTMRADTKSISIQSTPDTVVKFLADPQNLPRWAVGFAKSVRNDGGRWIVTTGSDGEIGVRIDADARSGVVDFFMSQGPGGETLAGSRVLPNGSGSEFIFTQFQPPGMSDDVFNKNVHALTQELTVLKAVLEVECPL
jgi:hypothetical protein